MRLFVVFVLGVLMAWPAAAQPLPSPTADRSPQKAFALSLVVPGLGHRYAQGGSWQGRATTFALADAALWTSLIASVWRQDYLVESYQTLAASQAGAEIAGKDRTFYLNLASFESSDVYLETQLRNRAWDRIDYVADPSFQWAWSSTEAFADFRGLREDAESLRRRRPILIGLLVANRLVAGLSSIRAVGRANAPALAFSAAPETGRPVVHMSMRF
ncbi:MAG: hypothetical protein AAGJ10_04905 [Bacteroidota bacterium]